jgi:hypothetical protein
MYKSRENSIMSTILTIRSVLLYYRNTLILYGPCYLLYNDHCISFALNVITMRGIYLSHGKLVLSSILNIYIFIFGVHGNTSIYYVRCYVTGKQNESYNAKENNTSLLFNMASYYYVDCKLLFQLLSENKMLNFVYVFL